MQHGKSHDVIGRAAGIATDDQTGCPRGFEAGRGGMAGRLVVPGKPGNAGGGKGPWLETNVESGEGPEIGKPSNSIECSEATEGVTGEGEGIS